MIISERKTGVHSTIGLDSTGILMSASEYDALSIEDCDEGYRYELIRGVLIVSPFSSESERAQITYLITQFGLYQSCNSQGKCLDSVLFEQELQIGDERRRCDLAIWTSLGRVPDARVDVPAIVVEFVSPGKAAWRRDYIEKREQYLAHGVKEYWVIDRFDRTMSVFKSVPQADTEIVVREKDVYRPELLPGFELALDKLLAVADQYASKNKS